MSTAAMYARKYSATTSKSSGGFAREIDSTKYWVGLTLDIKDMRKMLMTASFDDKFKLMQALTIAERKQAWHYRQDNFDLRRANIIISAVERTQNML